MSVEEDFARALRQHVDTVRPPVAVDTSHVISGARRRRTLRRSAAATALLTAVTAVVVVLSAQPWATRTSTPPAQTPTVSATPVATVSTVGPLVTYWHSRIETEVGGVLVTSSESWTGDRGSGLSVDDDDMSHARVTEAFRLLVANDALSWDDLQQLPTDPVALEAFVRDRPVDGETREPDTALVDQLVNFVCGPTTQEVRLAAWTVASGLPGSVVTTGATGSRGQPGTLVQHHGNGYLFDPATGLMLEYTSHDARIVYLDQYLTDTLPAGTPPS
jgi:hypothetical protein